MKQPGRKSTAQLEVVGKGKIVERSERPLPPGELTGEQAAVWQSVVDALPAEWFPPETHELLVMYCRHVITARRVGEMIAEYEADIDFTIGGYKTLLTMQESEGRSISSLATRMRLTQQSTYDKEKSKGKGRGVKRPGDDK